MPDLKYPKPKILLVDQPDDVHVALVGAGYNVSQGSFGSPYVVTASDHMHPVDSESCELPNGEEQEVIIVNTGWPDENQPSGPARPGDGVKAVWQRGVTGEIDPRPLNMRHWKDAFDNILRHGGLFIVMLSRPYVARYDLGTASSYHFERGENFSCGNWEFLSELNKLEREVCNGSEITWNESLPRLSSILRRGSGDVEYQCRISPRYDQAKTFIPVAKNKYGHTVAALLAPDDNRKGVVLLLPQMPAFGEIAAQLLGEMGPQLRADLFPFHEGQKWIHRPEYEIPAVLELTKKIDDIQSAAAEQVAQLQAEVDQVRAAKADWYTLLTGTGANLVAAVIAALQALGFEKVVDVDNAEGTDQRQLREDIQIHDRVPALVVDVKGISGTPEDGEVNQAEKHALMRAKEFNVYMKPLAIINHQRNIPPHERNPSPYRKEIVANAEQTGLGLMTTWDLFLLLRNKERLNWSKDVVLPVFYRVGRIHPIPEHYVEVGAIVGVWEAAFGVVSEMPLKVGDTIAFLSGDYFEEMSVTSLKVDDTSVQIAEPHSKCGIACVDAKKRVRKGMRVFLAQSNEAG